MKYTVCVSCDPFPDIRAAAFGEAQIDWWDDRQSDIQATCTLCWAATELEKYLPGDVVLRTLPESLDSIGSTVILLGCASDPQLISLSQSLSLPLCSNEKERLRICGGQRNGTNFVLLSGGDRVGTLYAAYAYLERLGLRFLEPGAPCTDTAAACFDPEFDITEAPDYTTRGTMSSFINASEEFLEWMAHNRFNSGFFRKANHHFAMRKKLGIDSVVGGHQMFYLFADTTLPYPYKHAVYGGEGLPEDPYPVSPLCRAPSGPNGELTYGDAHPEWYALIDGQRRMRRDRTRFLAAGNAPGDNMCTANEDAMTELCRLIVDSLIDGEWKYADHVHIWPLDNGAWCQCEACQKQGNYTARILALAQKVNRAIQTAYAQGRLKRRILLICPAYHETLPVPDVPLPEDFDYENIMTVFYPIERCFVHDLDDPICTETNQTLMERLLPWSNNPHYRGELVIGEYYNVSAFAAMPFVLTSRILHEIPMYYRIGARHFHYMHITARDWGFIAINNYLHGKLLWDTHADPNALTAGYFSGRYGTLAPRMQALYAQLEQATANCKYYKHYQFVNGKITRLFTQLSTDKPQTEDSLFPLVHMKLRSRADNPQAGPSLLETLEGLENGWNTLQTLLQQKVDTQTQHQLQRDARRLRFGVKCTRFLYLMCLCTIGEGDAATLEALRTLAEELEADTQSMAGYDFGTDFENALTATWVSKPYFTRFAPNNSAANLRDAFDL